VKEAEIPYCHVKRRAQSRGDVMSEERAAPAIADQVILSHLLCKINHAIIYKIQERASFRAYPCISKGLV
jgi:hypothetical protein